MTHLERPETNQILRKKLPEVEKDQLATANSLGFFHLFAMNKKSDSPPKKKAKQHTSQRCNHDSKSRGQTLLNHRYESGIPSFFSAKFIKGLVSMRFRGRNVLGLNFNQPTKTATWKHPPSDFWLILRDSNGFVDPERFVKKIQSGSFLPNVSRGFMWCGCRIPLPRSQYFAGTWTGPMATVYDFWMNSLTLGKDRTCDVQTLNLVNCGINNGPLIGLPKFSRWQYGDTLWWDSGTFTVEPGETLRNHPSKSLVNNRLLKNPSQTGPFFSLEFPPCNLQPPIFFSRISCSWSFEFAFPENSKHQNIALEGKSSRSWKSPSRAAGWYLRSPTPGDERKDQPRFKMGKIYIYNLYHVNSTYK